MFESLLSAVGYQMAPANGALVFLLLTILLGGGAAFRAGRAVAEGWGELWPLAIYAALIAAAVRFLHFALFAGPLLSSTNFAIDTLVLIAIATLSYRMRRVRQMTEQYAWAMTAHGPLGWRRRQ